VIHCWVDVVGVDVTAASIAGVHKSQGHRIQPLTYAVVAVTALWLFVLPGELLGTRKVSMRLGTPGLCRKTKGWSPTSWSCLQATGTTAYTSTAGSIVGDMSDSVAYAQSDSGLGGVGHARSRSGSKSSSNGTQAHGSMGARGSTAGRGGGAGRAPAEDELYSAPSMLYGPVLKTGPLNPAAWLKPHAMQRHAQYWRYLAMWEQQHPPEAPLPHDVLPPPPPLVFPKCQVGSCWLVSRGRLSSRQCPTDSQRLHRLGRVGCAWLTAVLRMPCRGIALYRCG
jgi:hypothetical protein